MTYDLESDRVKAALSARVSRVGSAVPDPAALKLQGRRRRMRRRAIAVTTVMVIFGSASAGWAVKEISSGANRPPVASENPDAICPQVAIDILTPSGTRSVGILRPDCEVNTQVEQGDLSQATLSSDHSKLAYVSRAEGGVQIRVLDRRTGSTSRVYQSDTPVGDLAWSPDESELAFWQERNQKAVVQILDVGDGRTSELTDPDVMSTRPVWNSSGTAVAVSEGQRRVVVYSTTGEARRAVPTEFEVTLYDWSPDDEQLVVARSTDNAILTVPVQSGRPAKLIGNPSPDVVLDVGWGARGVLVASSSPAERKISVVTLSPDGDGPLGSVVVDGEPNLRDNLSFR